MSTDLPRPRLRVPGTAAAGEVVEIRTLLTHPMETGLRRDADGAVLPRRVAERFECRFEGETFYACDLSGSVAANPYLSFYLRVERSGTVEAIWYDQDGTPSAVTASIAVG